MISYIKLKSMISLLLLTSIHFVCYLIILYSYYDSSMRFLLTLLTPLTFETLCGKTFNILNKVEHREGSSVQVLVRTVSLYCN